MRRKLSRIISVASDATGRLLIVLYAFAKHLRKNGNTMNQFISSLSYTLHYTGNNFITLRLRKKIPAACKFKLQSQIAQSADGSHRTTTVWERKKRWPFQTAFNAIETLEFDAFCVSRSLV